MSIWALSRIALFLTVATSSSAAYAAGGSVTIGTLEIPWTVIVAALGCLLVRIVLYTESKNKLVVYNLAISGLAILSSIVYTIENVTTLTGALGVGLGMGAGAVALIEAAKSKFVSIIKEALLKALTAGASGKAE